jgi:hypothetical protein
MTDHDRATSLRVLTDPALGDFMRSDLSSCSGFSHHAKETMELVLDGRSHRRDTLHCDATPVSLARETLNRLAAHYQRDAARR